MSFIKDFWYELTRKEPELTDKDKSWLAEIDYYRTCGFLDEETHLLSSLPDDIKASGYFIEMLSDRRKMAINFSRSAYGGKEDVTNLDYIEDAKQLQPNPHFWTLYSVYVQNIKDWYARRGYKSVNDIVEIYKYECK